MNIGIIASANDNLFASTLVARLIQQSLTPACILCAEPTKLRVFLTYARIAGFRAAVRKAVRQVYPGGLPDLDARHYLQKYAAKLSLPNWDSRLRRLSRKHKFAFRRVNSVNSDAAVAFVRQHKVNLLVNAGGSIYREPILQAAAGGMLNAHMGLLPMFRGMNVLEWSIWAGQPLGVTVHYVEKGIDMGDVLASEPIPVGRDDTIATLRCKSYAISVETLVRCVNEIAAGRPTCTPQRTEAGRQYFAMHPRLLPLMERRLERFYKSKAAGRAKK